MNEFAVTLDDGRIMTVFAWTEADIHETLTLEHGIERDNIVSIVRQTNFSPRYNMGVPYVEQAYMYL